MKLITDSERQRRDAEHALRAAAKASRAKAPDEMLTDAPRPETVWRQADLPAPPTAEAGVPLSEGVTSVFLGAFAYVPVALATHYSPWNYLVAAVLVLALSYALWSRRVLVGPGYVAVRKFGPYRVASAEAVTSGSLRGSQRGGVLMLRTSDGRTMRLRRVEYSQPDVNAALHDLVLQTGRRYDEGAMRLLALPFREEFGHHRYLLDAVQ